MASEPPWEMIDGAPYVVVHLHLTPPAGASMRQLTLKDDGLHGWERVENISPSTLGSRLCSFSLCLALGLG